MTTITTVVVTCDTCGEEIDQTQPFFHITDPSAEPGSGSYRDFHTDHVPDPADLSKQMREREE